MRIKILLLLIFIATFMSCTIDGNSDYQENEEEAYSGFVISGRLPISSRGQSKNIDLNNVEKNSSFLWKTVC